MTRVPIRELPWPFAFGLVGFVIAFFLQFRIRYHIDPNKVRELDQMSELYPRGGIGLPPRKILTERGKWLLLCFYCGYAAFLLCVVLFMILYAT